MIVTRDLIERSEHALDVDPRRARRALVERPPSAEADPTAVQRRLAHVLGEGADASEVAIDRILTGCDILNVNYLERGMIAADAVARIEVRGVEGQLVGYGTGFMVSPRLLLTNHHVLRTAAIAGQSWADFRVEFDALGRLAGAATFAFDPAAFFFTDPELDVTIVAVMPETPDHGRRVTDFGWLRLSPSADTVLRGEWLSLVQHTAGRAKQVSIRQNLLIKLTDEDAWYVSDTATGSSGAPVFNDSWQVVAVHRLGAPARGPSGEILTVDGERWSEQMDESQIVWRATVGTRAAVVVALIAAACQEHPLVQELLREGEADAADAIVVPLGAGSMRAAPMPSAPAEVLTPAPNAALAVVDRGRGSAEPDYMVPDYAAPIRVPTPALPEAPIPAASGNGAGVHLPDDSTGASITVTVPLRITVRPASESGRAPMVGVDLS